MPNLPRTIFTNADIVPHFCADGLKAEAFCTAAGRILHVGSLAEVRRAAGPGSTEVDLCGGVVYPGFIDTHSHLSSCAECLDRVDCGLSNKSVAGVLKALRAASASIDNDGWVLGYGYDDSGLPDNRHLTRHDLDEVSRDKPVFVVHISVHFAYGNTKALELLGITKDSRFDGGEVGLGEDGLPSGYLAEMAAIAAMGRLPTSSPDKLRSNLSRAIAVYNSQGFTTIMDGGIGLSGDAEQITRSYLDLMREDSLNARVYLQFLPQIMDTLRPLGLYHFGSDYLTLGGLKFFLDGSIQGFTGALLEDYHTRPGHKGTLLLSEEEICSIVGLHHQTGIQVAMHANGDRAVEAALQAFEKAISDYGHKDLRHMIIHAQTASDSQLERMKACDIIPSFFARHIEVWGDRHAAIFLGPERTERLNPAGSSVRLNLPFTLHVDTPVLPVTALGAMHAAVNRISSGGILMGPDQRITPLEALKAYTTTAALCCGGEHDRGKIASGRFADFVVLSDNLESIPAENLRDVRVNMTFTGGRMVYQA
ncbi:MAG: amidohydrolase [Desulfovibrio sp.]|nr:amidohydrolase [Desulfovibrio sp.]